VPVLTAFKDRKQKESCVQIFVLSHYSTVYPTTPPSIDTSSEAISFFVCECVECMRSFSNSGRKRSSWIVAFLEWPDDEMLHAFSHDLLLFIFILFLAFVHVQCRVLLALQ
jgi:hypothetical protein